MQQPPLKDLKIGALAKTDDASFLVVDPVNGCVLMLEQASGLFQWEDCLCKEPVSHLSPDTLITHYGEAHPYNPESDIPELAERIKWFPF